MKLALFKKERGFNKYKPLHGGDWFKKRVTSRLVRRLYFICASPRRSLGIKDKYNKAGRAAKVYLRALLLEKGAGRHPCLCEPCEQGSSGPILST